jgi:CMP-N-acetylneuraminic acid synthetase
MSDLLAIIPARGGSKRFPRKNAAKLGGRPLLAYAIDAARDSGVVNRVCVSSDDEEILALATSLGAEGVRRSAPLATDTAQVKDVCAALLEASANAGQRPDAFAVLLPTSPLRTAGDVRSAYELFTTSGGATVMSVVPFDHPPQRALRAVGGRLEPVAGLDSMKPAQQLEPLYRHDGAVIIANTATFLREGEFYGRRVVPYFIGRERSVDIDAPIDLAWAEFLLATRG